ncbi:MAG: hypothetical protein Kow0079_14480 [Vicingaceae bacterium]
MKKLLFILFICFSVLSFSQSARDINLIIQKTLDLHALKDKYNEDEKSGKIPLIIINDDKIPNNLIVFKFNKRVKIMTFDEIETFKSIYKGNLDSYFIFENIEFNDDFTEVVIDAKFRKTDAIPVHVSMKKENNNWVVVESKAG